MEIKLQGHYYLMRESTRRALMDIIENESNRSFEDCINHVKKIPDSKIAELTKKARKFVR